MPTILFKKENFQGKDGRKWVNLQGLSDSGAVVTALLAQDAYEAFEIPDSAFASKTQIAELFKELPVVDVFFNQRGRLEKIEI